MSYNQKVKQPLTYEMNLNDEQFLAKITSIIDANLGDENFGVDELVKATGLSHAKVLHQLKSVSQKNISQFICEIRLQKAREILQNESVTAAEVAYRVGYSSPAYFNSCFHEYFGYTPGDVKKIATHTNKISVSESGSESATKNSFKKLFEKRRLFFVRLSQITVTAIILWLAYMAFFNNQKTDVNGKNERSKSIAVLPFKFLGNDKENQQLADGITEGFINRLNQIGNLKVISRTSSEHYRESGKSAPEIGRELNVAYILEGSIQCYQNTSRISVQLIDAKKDQHILSEQFDRELEDIFALQSSIVKQVAERLQMTLTTDEIARIDKVPTKNREAYNYYLQGRYFWNQRTEKGVKKSIEYFTKAVETDPEYAVAMAGLADGYFILTWYDWYQPQKEGYEKAKTYANEALKLDNQLADAYTVLAAILNWNDWDWEESRKTFKKAIELNPNNSVTHQYYAELLQILDEKPEARLEINQAIELDPISFVHRVVNYLEYYYEEKYNESLLECYKTLEINPEYPSSYPTMFFIHIELGNDSLAVEAIEKWMLLDTLRMKDVPVIHQIYRQSKIEDVIRFLIESEKNKLKPNPTIISSYYCLLGEKENALTWLEKAFNKRSSEIPRINVNPELDILRAEPRFLKIIDEMGLTKYHKRKPKPVEKS